MLVVAGASMSTSRRRNNSFLDIVMISCSLNLSQRALTSGKPLASTGLHAVPGWRRRFANNQSRLKHDRFRLLTVHEFEQHGHRQLSPSGKLLIDRSQRRVELARLWQVV